MSKQTEIREQITLRIVSALKAGTVPWRQPWSGLMNTGHPANIVSKRTYTGVNTLLLHLVRLERGYSSRWWGTFRQWQELGFRIKARPASVRSGEWGTKIVFCKPMSKKPGQDQADDHDQESEVPGRERRFLLLRQFTVFSAEQCEGSGIERFLVQPRSSEPFTDFTPAEEAIAATNARITLGGNKAVYYPQQDYIQLPPKESFEGQKEFYSTALHELLHWSGHESRLARLSKNARFGSEAYAVEELVAEIGSSFLCSEIGVPQSDDLSNQAAYLASWLAVLQADASAIFTAASQASAAADYILSFSRKEEDDEAGDEDDEAVVAGVGGVSP